jgi:DNA-binding protein HU-beta
MFIDCQLTPHQRPLFEKKHNVNKNDLAKAIYEAHGGLSYADAQEIIDQILETIKGRLIDGEKVQLSRFGSFRVVSRRNRKGINPQTGKPIVIQGRRAVAFKPSKYLKLV